MELIGAKFCPFRRAIEVMLTERGDHFTILDRDEQRDYPILTWDDLRLHGLIAILEELAPTDTVPHQRRMWFWIILNELWFNCAKEIVHERIIVIKSGIKSNPHKVHDARIRLKHFLTDTDSWLKDNHYLDLNFSYSDILLASIISYIDYLNEIDWDLYKHVRVWYSGVKARPSFKFILHDTIPGLRPPLHYGLIEF